ncbi:MAG: SMP-30/gluconolactonase/LRE family protein [Pirellulales bacterium]|nr:SMP-30/gluconolactonase/LRE family protein [Pirellulales bacterium]
MPFPHSNRLAALVLGIFALSCPNMFAGEPIPGIGPAGEIRQLHTGFKFTEGPASDGHGNLYFTDIPNTTIHRLDAAGKLSVFTDQSRHANGLMFNSSGELVACEMDGQLAVWNVQTKQRRVLIDAYQGERFNAPNDLVIDRRGGIYFTDPYYRAPQPLPQGELCVYYFSSQGDVTRLLEIPTTPNGILLAPDEQTLYVFPSDGHKMYAYEVREPGQLGPGREFCTIKTPGDNPRGGCDGVTVDVQGNLYLTTRLGVQVFSPAGELLGIIKLPEKPANVTFGGPQNKTLYATACTSLYAVPMHIQGHRFAMTR